MKRMCTCANISAERWFSQFFCLIFPGLHLPSYFHTSSTAPSQLSFSFFPNWVSTDWFCVVSSPQALKVKHEFSACRLCRGHRALSYSYFYVWMWLTLNPQVRELFDIAVYLNILAPACWKGWSWSIRHPSFEANSTNPLWFYFVIVPFIIIHI